MIGRCPHCGIELKKPPFNNRETNEVMIVLIYRQFVESGDKVESMKTAGYCKVCRAKPEDLKEQKILLTTKNL